MGLNLIVALLSTIMTENTVIRNISSKILAFYIYPNVRIGNIIRYPYILGITFFYELILTFFLFKINTVSTIRVNVTKITGRVSGSVNNPMIYSLRF